MSWSNQRENLVSKGAWEMTVRCRFIDKALGTRPNNDEIYREFIASKAPDAPSMEEEIAATGLDRVQDKAITVFPVGLFWKTPDDIFYDFNDIDPNNKLFDPNATDEEREKAVQCDKDGNIITKHDGISVFFNEDHEKVPYYIDPKDPKNKTNLVPGDWVECPFLWNYQWIGSFKETVGMLQRVTKKKADVAVKPETVTMDQVQLTDENGEPIEQPKKRKRRTKAEIEAAKAAEAMSGGNIKYKCADMKAYKKTIDGNWFVLQRRIPILVPDTWVDDLGHSHPSYFVDKNGIRRLNLFERSIRAETAQGPRTALSSSEFVPAGSEFYFTVRLLNPSDRYIFFECMDYKEYMGMLQWRSGGMGRLIWTPANENGKEIDLDITTL